MNTANSVGTMSNGGSPNSRFRIQDAVTPTGDDCERVPMRRSASASPSPPPPPADRADTGATTEEGEPDTCESSVGGGSPPPAYLSANHPPAPVSSSRVDNVTGSRSPCNPAIASVPSIELPDGKILQRVISMDH